MRVFISHKQEDEHYASAVARQLRLNDSECYLDVFDPHSKDGPHLSSYLKEKLSECTDLIAVVSDKTQSSWWVPWEIGVADEKEYPLATYAAGNCSLPTFLMKWPYLQSMQDIDTYVKVRQQTENQMWLTKQATDYRSKYAQAFYTNIRSALGQ